MDRSHRIVLPLRGLGLDSLNITHLPLVQNARGIRGVDSKRICQHHSTIDSFFLNPSFHVNQGCLTSYLHEMSSKTSLIPSRVAARYLGHPLRKGPDLYQNLIRRSHDPSLVLAPHPEESYLQALRVRGRSRLSSPA